MLSLIINRHFKRKFREISFKKRYELCSVLEKVYDFPEGVFLHAVLNRYFSKYPNVYLNKDLAKKVLHSQFENGSFFIVDYDEPYQGGFNITNKTILNEDELYNDPEITERINVNWREYCEQLSFNFWEDQINVQRFQNLGNFELYEDRGPKNDREKLLASGQEIFIDGRIAKIKYNFYNKKEVTKYYLALVNEFYPDFKIVKNISNNKIKKFGKKISDNIYLGLHIDFGFLESELDKTYLELPKMKVEVFSDTLNSYIKEEIYLRDQEDFPIARVNFYFFGNPDNFRMGNSSENALVAKRRLFYYSYIYSFYLNQYLSMIEKCLIQTLREVESE